MAERRSPLELDPETFRALGHRLVDERRSCSRTAEPASRRSSPGETPADVLAALGGGPLPEHGSARRGAAPGGQLVVRHSLFNGHPRFFGYITCSPAPLGVLGDLLAAARQPERRRLGDLADRDRDRAADRALDRRADRLPGDGGGLLVSGGNMANFVAFLAGSRAKASAGRPRQQGSADGRLRVYCSAETHTWIQKAADLFGLGTDAIRWIETDEDAAHGVDALRERSPPTATPARPPFLVVGAGGTVSTGAVDPLTRAPRGLRRGGFWFHVDGAYGGVRRVSCRTRPADLQALRSGGLARDRPAQVAVRAARGGLRPRSRSGHPRRRVRLPPALLPPATTRR